MRPIRSVAGRPLHASLLVTVLSMLGVLLMPGKGSVTFAGENVLQGLELITNEMLERPAPKGFR